MIAATAAALAIGLSSPPAVAAPNCPDLRPRLRSPQPFVAGLAGAWVPLEARHCLYIVPAHMSRPAPIFRISSGRRLRGPVWSPTKPELAIAFRRGTGFEVAVVGTAGEPRRRFLGRDATFFRDGRMLLRRRDQLRLVAGNVTTTLLAAGGRLRRAAGFPVTGYDLSGTDGYGRAGAIVVVWAELRSRVLLVRPNGTLVRVSPIYEAETGESMPGAPAWSPDGRILLIPGSTTTRPFL